MAGRKKASTKTKVKILLPVAGKFNLSYDVGKTYEVENKLAKELITAKYAVKA